VHAAIEDNFGYQVPEVRWPVGCAWLVRSGDTRKYNVVTCLDKAWRPTRVSASGQVLTKLPSSQCPAEDGEQKDRTAGERGASNVFAVGVAES
jgi:hypothetical protein